MKKVLELKGYKSLRAMNAFHTLLMGLKMLPAYMSVDYQEFFASFKDMPEAKKETYLREALAFVQLNEDEVAALLSFVTDANGIPYSAANIGSMKPDEMFENIILVCMEIGRIKITIVSDEEKKKLPTSQLTCAEPT